ncbi:MAG TPA: hypothetical protein VF708_08155 [Pyrinomonadaceae bacterium]|jgi:hypothetical protein
MDKIIQSELDQQILIHQTNRFSARDRLALCQRFRSHGFIKVPDVVPPELRDAAKKEVIRLLDEAAERRDLKLATTDYTPRKMSVVRSEIIAENSPLINAIYNSEPLLKFLAAIAREPLYSCPSKDEEFLISRHEKKGDTHGWHWGDFSFALIWILETPPIEYGGMLQCIPHTDWDKANPRIHEYLCENQITTYGFVSGDIYFLRTDTTLHRTIPLNRDATRIMLNMTWASTKDLSRQLVEDDRWWEDTEAEAAVLEVEEVKANAVTGD